MCLAELAVDPSTFRLNSRDHVREQLTTDKPENSFKQFLHAKGGAANSPNPNPTAVSISVQHLETTDFPEIKHDHDVESGTTTGKISMVPAPFLDSFSDTCCP